MVRTKVLLLLLCCMFVLQGGAFAAEGRPVTPNMIMVKAGSFVMGDEVGDLWSGCQPVHQVDFSYDFLIGQYPVTFREYDQYTAAVEAAPAHDHGWGREDRPVIYVNWWDALRYCNWLSAQQGFAPAYDDQGRLLDGHGQVTEDIRQVQGYRLLTEAEWEYAASGGPLAEQPRFLYAGSNDLREVGWYAANSGEEEWRFVGSALRTDYSRHGGTLYEGRSTQPVGMLQPNALGVYDMSGNVFEWCYDYYGPYTEEPKQNPLGSMTGHTRVMRGGSWVFGANDCRVACRLYRSPHDRIFRIGFRLARTMPVG